MPADPNKKPISVRVTPEQHKAWTDAAGADQRSLEMWIRRNCDAAAAKAGFPVAGAPPRKRRARRS